MSAWTVITVNGYTISHRFFARNPTCPDGRHPTRDCGCKPFRTLQEAEKYATAKTKETQP